MQEYVCGFLFDSSENHVVLVRKNKPEWQKGLLNGVGGKIELGETPEVAMTREFTEETGIVIEDWKPMIILNGVDWKVYFYASKNDWCYSVNSLEQEEILIVEVEDLFASYSVIPNLNWLIPFCLDQLKSKYTINGK